MIFDFHQGEGKMNLFLQIIILIGFGITSTSTTNSQESESPSQNQGTLTLFAPIFFQRTGINERGEEVYIWNERGEVLWRRGRDTDIEAIMVSKQDLANFIANQLDSVTRVYGLQAFSPRTKNENLRLETRFLTFKVDTHFGSAYSNMTARCRVMWIQSPGTHYRTMFLEDCESDELVFKNVIKMSIADHNKIAGFYTLF